MILDAIRKRKAAKEAAELLRNSRIAWGQGHWFQSIDGSDSISGSETLGTIRGWLRQRGVGSRNKACNTSMCAEGLILYVLAMDPTIPDDIGGRQLLDQFSGIGRDVAISYGWAESGDWDGIPTLNDDYFGDDSEEEIIRFLDEIGDRAE